MIFAAGLGTRLRPLTGTIPKALVKIEGKPLLEIVIDHLKNHGVKEIVVNVHHFADQVIDFIHASNHFDIRVEISEERDLLLDTGGGLKKVEWFFDDRRPFIVHNVDIISDIDIRNFYQWHAKQGALASLVVRERPGKRFLLFNAEMQLCGWKNTETGKQVLAREAGDRLIPLAFSSIHVIDPRIFSLINEEGVFSIRDLYLRLAGEHKILGYKDNTSRWVDVGTHDSLAEGQRVYREIRLSRG